MAFPVGTASPPHAATTTMNDCPATLIPKDVNMLPFFYKIKFITYEGRESCCCCFLFLPPPCMQYHTFVERGSLPERASHDILARWIVPLVKWSNGNSRKDEEKCAQHPQRHLLWTIRDTVFIFSLSYYLCQQIPQLAL